MKIRLLIYSMLLFCTACSSEKDLDIIGIWTTVIEGSNAETIKDRMEFKKDGTWNVEAFLNDSMEYKMSGTYTLDSNNRILKIYTNGKSFHHTMVECTHDQLITKDEQGNTNTMKRVE